MRTAYYLANKDSLMPAYALMIFQAKNKDGDMIESYAKKKLGKKYEDYFLSGKDSTPNEDKLRSLAKSPKFISLVLKVNNRFLKNDYYRKNFIRYWNNSHNIFNEIICSKKEYKQLVEKTLEDNKFYFTLIMFPFILQSFKIDWQ